ncbi:hypothetical protein V6N13_089012 [Hibiscus sabdariffa]
MLQLHLGKCFGNLLRQDDKGDVSAETTGPAQAVILIAFPFVYFFPAEAGVFGSHQCLQYSALVFSIALAILASTLLDFKMHWRVLKDVHHMACLGVICSSSYGMEVVFLVIVRPAGVLPLRLVEASGIRRSAERISSVVGAGALCFYAVELSGMSTTSDCA